MKLKQKYIGGTVLATMALTTLAGCQQATAPQETAKAQTQTTKSTGAEIPTTQTTPITPSTNATSATYKDGTYTGVANGYRPNLNVNVTVSGGKISAIEIGENDETPRFFERANPTVVNEIVAKQTTKVTAVSGATRSSNGIMQATANALAKAK